ncbi:hypothetical protein [Haloarchaeobius sp. DFWS5]|uniref:hypothetical protein n=1 Tax=Haloarchaeobius sp. DFWS5 TaxID=3446114 RepID=UPI003EB8A0A1
MKRHEGPLFGSHRSDLVVGIALIWAAVIVALSSGPEPSTTNVLAVVVTAALATVGLVVLGVTKYGIGRSR